MAGNGKPAGGYFKVNFSLRGPSRPLGVDFDEEGGCLYVRIREGKAARTLEVKEEILADYDRRGGSWGSRSSASREGGGRRSRDPSGGRTPRGSSWRWRDPDPGGPGCGTRIRT